MILPLSDAPNPRGVPFVTYGLIAANVIIFVLITWPLSQQRPSLDDPMLQEYVQVVREALPPQVSLRDALQQVSAYDLYVFRHGFRPARPEWVNLLTSIFLHGGLLHLFGNMLFLWIYGDNVEHRLGRVRYLICYLLTGVMATLFYMIFAGASKLPLIGASGAISGVLGFYFLWFPHNTVRVFVFLFPIFMRVIEVPARLVLGVYLVLDNILPWLLSQGMAGGGVAHGAHIGGFLAGLALAWWMDRREISAAPKDYRSFPSAPEPPPVIAMEDAINQGRLEQAARSYFALPREQTKRVLSPAHSLELGQWLVAHGHAEAALTVFLRHIRDYPSGPGVAEAHLGAGLVQLESFGQAASAYQHFLDALELDPLPETERQARAALELIAGRQKYRLRRFS